MGIEAPEVITTRTLFRPPAAAMGPALSPDEYEHEFLQAIAEAVRSFRTPEEPLPDVVLADQAKARLYFAIDGMTHSFFAKVFPSCLMNVAAKCPYQDVRREIIEDCYCEEITDPDARDMCHVEVLYYDARAARAIPRRGGGVRAQSDPHDLRPYAGQPDQDAPLGGRLRGHRRA